MRLHYKKYNVYKKPIVILNFRGDSEAERKLLQKKYRVASSTRSLVARLSRSCPSIKPSTEEQWVTLLL